MSAHVVARAPGRVNLIGEHTDYQGGFVLPVAIDRGVMVTAGVRTDGEWRFKSLAFGEEAILRPDADPSTVEPAWARYPAAILTLLAEKGLPPVGLDLTIGGDLPVGGGLSSSAAVTVATGLAALALARGAIGREDRLTLARLCRDAEAMAAGVRCGLMDPYCSLFATEGMAMLLDCRSEEHESVGIDPGRIAFVLADSGVRHELAAGEYEKRRAECERAVECLGAPVESLRDLRRPFLVTLPEPLEARVVHVVTENERTVEAADALTAGDLDRIGSLLDESQRSLADDYDVSCPEVDALVAKARGIEGVAGARLTGGGFGGHVVAAVRPDRASAVADALDGRVVRPSGGAWAAIGRSRRDH